MRLLALNVNRYKSMISNSQCKQPAHDSASESGDLEKLPLSKIQGYLDAEVRWILQVLTINYSYTWGMGFPGGSVVKICLQCGRPGFDPWVGVRSGGAHGNPLQYSWLEYPCGQRSLVGYSPWGHQESDTTEWLSTAQPILGKYLKTDYKNRVLIYIR